MPSTASTSIWYESVVMSANTGTRPDWTMGATSVENVSGEVMISSPGSRPSRSMAIRRAEDPEFTIRPNRLASLAATRSSSARVASPISSFGLSRITAATASISRSSCTAPAGGSCMMRLL